MPWGKPVSDPFRHSTNVRSRRTSTGPTKGSRMLPAWNRMEHVTGELGLTENNSNGDLISWCEPVGLRKSAAPAPRREP